MNLKDALEKNLSFKTEYGAGPKVVGGLFNRKKFNRSSYTPAGERSDDEIYESMIKVGPARLTHRSRNPNVFSGDENETAFTLFGLFAVSNDKDFLIKIKAGVRLGVLKSVLGLTPARPVAEVVDVDLASRAGLRLNVTRLLRDLKADERELDENAAQDEPDVDLS